MGVVLFETNPVIGFDNKKKGCYNFFVLLEILGGETHQKEHR